MEGAGRAPELRGITNYGDSALNYPADAVWDLSYQDAGCGPS